MCMCVFALCGVEANANATLLELWHSLDHEQPPSSVVLAVRSYKQIYSRPLFFNQITGLFIITLLNETFFNLNFNILLTR